MMRRACLSGLALLAACSQPAQQQPVPMPSAATDAASAGPVPTPSAAPVSTKSAPSAPAPAQPLTSPDPARVLTSWAKAMSLKQWDSAYLYWGDHGAGSGLTLAQFAAQWGKLSNPEFELHNGQTEGAAGSSFYTAPVVLIDGKRHVTGKIVLRRVNDVDGASAEQLRWHIESLSIKP